LIDVTLRKFESLRSKTRCAERTAPALLMALLGILAAVWAMAAGSPAMAIPAFAQQTGQPCSQCHVGAFGPQLKPYGRDFKLFGYVNGDGKNHLPQIDVIALASFTHTQKDQPAPPAPHLASNDNAVLDEISAYYGGKIAGGAGAFAEFTYDGVHRGFTIDKLDVRRAFDLSNADRDFVIGLDLNNQPAVEDLWNSTPAWGFPYNASGVAPTPNAAVLLDGALAQRVVGAGVYGMWHDMIYAEVEAYAPVDNATSARLGVETDANVYDGVMPYWRVAIEHEFDGQVLEAGAFGLSASRFPEGVRSAGMDRIRDVGFDATYQYVDLPNQFISAHATWIHETATLDASRILFGSRPSDDLDALRADVSYSYKDTWTPSVQAFRTSGARDPAVIDGLGGSPDSAGYVFELAVVPFGKAKAPSFISNVRFAVQWVEYTRFDGERRGASANNTLYVSTRLAFAPFSGLVQR